MVARLTSTIGAGDADPEEKSWPKPIEPGGVEG